MAKATYLVIGHLTKDILPNGRFAVGGTVAYSGQTAQVLGYETAVFTSASPDYDLAQALPGIAVCNIPAAASSTFENIYLPEGRVQKLHAVAAPLRMQDLPPDWLDADMVHLGPLTNEVEPTMVTAFHSSMIGMTPQGWMRRWDDNGRIFAQRWAQAQAILPLATAVILSTEDLLDDAMLTEFRQWAPLVVLTQGPKGCTVFRQDEQWHIPAPQVQQIEPTGAGDIFATSFLTRYRETDGDHCEAARFANEIASLSVTADGLTAKMERIRQHLAAPNRD